MQLSGSCEEVAAALQLLAAAGPLTNAGRRRGGRAPLHASSGSGTDGGGGRGREEETEAARQLLAELLVEALVAEAPAPAAALGDGTRALGRPAHPAALKAPRTSEAPATLLLSGGGGSRGWAADERAEEGAKLPGAWLDGFCRSVQRLAPALGPPMAARLLGAAAGLGVRAGAQGGGGGAEGSFWLDEPAAGRQRGRAEDGGGGGGAGAAAAMLRVLLPRCEQLLPDFRPRELCDLLTALAAMDAAPLLPPSLPRVALLQLQLQLPLSGGPEIVDTLWALRQLGICPYAHLGPEAPAFGRPALASVERPLQAVSFDSRGSPGAAAAGGTSGAPLGAGGAAWVDDVIVRLHATMPSLDARRLARLGAILGFLLRRRPPRAWLYEYYQRLRVEAAGMAPGDLVICLEGLAEVRLRLDDEVLSRVAAALRAGLGASGAALLARAVAALRRMYGKLPGRKAQQLVEEMERRSRWQG
ncbi:hypothetical protein MNEG_12261 [Monoraphidium neglectum]|uniref:Uncharacterized protein n=1 Tax=Monoraphidium neglectum TaxID=145388 RepID=A0A0D2J7F7_9CHLO|nr:hypothetical protein MNEG_12261 [Monoraphidium neglectum]KIY95702.1 hypothetical protein MNEG_12261 [Monoraphidium neglectum]|eukprot:XP_013894722.1 hypothetical protein MNEG_12261 [Monoraphidium neglectum]